MLNYILFLPLLFLFIGCGDGASNGKKAAFRGDVQRKAVSEQTWQDLSGLAWDDERSFGSIGNYYGTAPSAFPKEYQGLLFGVNEDTYERYSTKGDGNCWIRAGLRVFFHNIFNDEKLYNEFLAFIDIMSARYVPEALSHPIIDHPNAALGAPWIKGFPWQNFKQGIIFLKANFASQKYLEILNYHNVDWFFIAAMRALHSAEEEYIHNKRRYYLAFDYRANKYKAAAEIEEFWKKLIEEGKNRVDDNGKEVACGEHFFITAPSGKRKARHRFCSRSEIIKKIKNEDVYKGKMEGPANWGDPITLSYNELGKFFLIWRAATSGVYAGPAFYYTPAKSLEEGRCVDKYRAHFPHQPVFYDFYTAILPVHVNGNHYDVLVRKQAARFDYEAFYKTITVPEVSRKIRRCLENL